MKVLWVGPGMGDSLQHYWIKVFIPLLEDDDATLHISHLKLIDLEGIPKLFFGEEYAEEHGMEQETAQADFFRERGQWDIIILDFIEAWLLGNTPNATAFGGSWPEFGSIPYEYIRDKWEQKLLRMKPFQVWVRHDRDTHSTIIPRLEPDYKLVVKVRDPDYKEQYADISDDATFWMPKAALNHYGSFDVWQRIDIT